LREEDQHLPLFDDTEIRSVSEYIGVLKKVPSRKRVWFRGQTDKSWPLLPGLARPRYRRYDEHALLTTFRQNGRALVPAGMTVSNDWDWMLLMQHYGVPTRLLDWTESPLAALFFAVAPPPGSRRFMADGCVWVLDPIGHNRREAFARALPSLVPTLGIGRDLDGYIQQAITVAGAALPSIAVIAMRMFPRLVAQSGVFTLSYPSGPALGARGDRFLGRVTVPRACKREVVDELSQLGVTRLSLFPELESVADHAKERRS